MPKPATWFGMRVTITVRPLRLSVWYLIPSASYSMTCAERMLAANNAADITVQRRNERKIILFILQLQTREDSIGHPHLSLSRHAAEHLRPKAVPHSRRASQHKPMRTLVCLAFAFASFAVADVQPAERIKGIDNALLRFDTETAARAWEQTCGAVASHPSQQAICEHEAGAIAEAREDDRQAIAHYLRALDSWQSLSGSRVANRIVTMINLGTVYRRTHDSPAAERIFSAALQLAETSSNLDPVVRATLLDRAAGLDSDLDRYDAARAKLKQSLALLEPSGDAGKEELATSLNSLGMLELRSGDYRQGELFLRRALRVATEALGENSPETGAYMGDLGLALTIERQFSGAETLLHRARFIIESRLGPQSLRLIPVYAELGSLERETGKFALAEDDTERALAILVHHLPENSPEVVLTKVNLGSVYLRERKFPEAESVLPAAVEQERGLSLEGRTLADGLRTLASLRAQQRQYPEAEALYREAIGYYDASIGDGHPDVAPVLREYADVLRRSKGSKAEIKLLQTRIHAIEARAGRPTAS